MEARAKILVVDDTPSNLEVLIDVLSADGYDVAIAMSGERALKHLQNHIPDLILLDIQMPGIDGFETCQLIKSKTHTAHVPIIFITAFSDTVSIVKGFSLGAVDYISKPFQEVELLARVKTHLKLQSLNQALEQQVATRTQELATKTAELQETLHQLQVSQLQLIQREKMSTLGNLVAGVAHEINNPLVFVNNNIPELRQSIDEIIECLQLYRTKFPKPGEEIETLVADLEIDFLLNDLPKAFDSMEAGCNRIHDISNSLRTFSRIETESKFKANIHECLDSTVLILKYRLKANDSRPEIQVIRDYGTLSEIDCFPGQLNQVFMNLLANAIDMFDEVAESHSYEVLEDRMQQIIIKTCCVEDCIKISISDNGKGMSAAVCSQIFDRQFTTKAVGKGTGLGLAISKQIIVEKHGGQITVNSMPSIGTEFVINLPYLD